MNIIGYNFVPLYEQDLKDTITKLNIEFLRGDLETINFFADKKSLKFLMESCRETKFYFAKEYAIEKIFHFLKPNTKLYFEFEDILLDVIPNLTEHPKYNNLLELCKLWYNLSEDDIIKQGNKIENPYWDYRISFTHLTCNMIPWDNYSLLSTLFPNHDFVYLMTIKDTLCIPIPISPHLLGDLKIYIGDPTRGWCRMAGCEQLIMDYGLW